VVASAIAVHARNASELGMLPPERFREVLKEARAPPTYIPTPGIPAVFLRSGYAAHIQQARPPKDALAWPLPPEWGLVENVVVKEVL